jgi:hypothetical protein
VSTWNVTREPPGVTLAGYSYAKSHGMKVEIVTSYRVSHVERCSVTERVNVTSVYPTLDRAATGTGPFMNIDNNNGRAAL